VEESDELLLGDHALLFLRRRSDGLYNFAAARFAKYTIQGNRLRISEIDMQRLEFLINKKTISLNDLKSEIQNLNVPRIDISEPIEPAFIPSPHP
jgi:hypothetical protein